MKSTAHMYRGPAPLGAADQLTLQDIRLDEVNSTHVQRTCSRGAADQLTLQDIWLDEVNSTYVQRWFGILLAIRVSILSTWPSMMVAVRQITAKSKGLVFFYFLSLLIMTYNWDKKTFRKKRIIYISWPCKSSFVFSLSLGNYKKKYFL